MDGSSAPSARRGGSSRRLWAQKAARLPFRRAERTLTSALRHPKREDCPRTTRKSCLVRLAVAAPRDGRKFGASVFRETEVQGGCGRRAAMNFRARCFGSCTGTEACPPWVGCAPWGRPGLLGFGLCSLGSACALGGCKENGPPCRLPPRAHPRRRSTRNFTRRASPAASPNHASGLASGQLSGSKAGGSLAQIAPCQRLTSAARMG